MAIVKQRDKKSGRLYAYESKAIWDPNLKQSRPVRVYLGRVNEETGEIIPTTRKNSGRRSKAEETSAEDRASYKDKYDACVEKLQHQLQENQELKSRISDLQEENQQLRRILAKIHEESSIK